MMSASGEATFYRVRPDGTLRALTYRRFRDVVLEEVVSLVADNDGKPGLRTAIYTGASLEPIGGSFEIDCRFGVYDSATLRAALILSGGLPEA